MTTSATSLRVTDDDLWRSIAERASRPDGLERLERQGEQCGWCAHPIQLLGSSMRVNASTGEVMSEYSTLNEPEGVLLKACGTRRATRCPACATIYRADARMLVRAGLVGGKGVSESVSDHPLVFATFTAPSFGAVHRTARPGVKDRCHAGAARRCPHGRSTTCGARHRPEDEVVGQALCADCYDYEGAVRWNATCPELWRRTTIGITRALAQHYGTSVAGLRKVVRLSFVKVAEFQRRGVVHLHAVIRLDGVDVDEMIAPAPLVLDVATLFEAVRSVAARVNAPSSDGSTRACWGRQFDIREIADEWPTNLAGDVTSNEWASGARRIANYVAKYATKSTDDSGALDRRLSGLDDLERRNLSAHLRRMVETAWRLGGVEGNGRLRRWAHSLGFAGHFLTKSRRYSVTFKFLRAERQRWQIERQRTRPGRPSDSEDLVTIGRWVWVGAGWPSAGDAWLAGVFQRERERSRLCARDERTVDASSSQGRDSWL